MRTMQRLGCDSLIRAPLLSVSLRSRRQHPGPQPRLSRCLRAGDLPPRSRAKTFGRDLLQMAPQASAGQAPAGRNLIVAVDSSPDSHYACEWLINNIYREGDTVHVVHCIPYYPRSGIYVMPDGRLATLDFDVLLRNEDQFLMAAEKAVADWCADALERAEVRYVVDLLREQPGAEDKDVVGAAICSKARDLQAGVVVIASHAKSGLSEFFMGSVANYCAHHCDSPVLVLHQPKQGEEQEQQGWLAGVSRLLKPRVKAEAVGAAAVGARAQRAAAGVAQATSSAEDSGLITSADLSSGDESHFGQTADFPGIGSQAAAAFVDPPATALNVQHAEEHAQRQQQPHAAGGGANGAGGGPRKRHLVLAVDDSDTSERACTWAVENLYQEGGDVVHLLHIIPAMPYRWDAVSSSPYRATYGFGGAVMDGFVFYMEPPNEDFKKATELYVGKRFVSKLEARGIQPKVEIITERADESVAGIGSAICKHVEQLPEEAVVVVGSHVRGGLAEFMLGSVATYLTHHCTKPVAVLH